MNAKMSMHQEKMEAAINSTRSELQNTIKHRMEDFLSCVDHKTQGLRKELIQRIDKTQVDLQAVKTSLNTWTKGFQQAITTTKVDLITELNLFHTEAQATRTQALTHQCNMEAKTEATRREFQSQLEAGAEGGRGPGGLGTCFLWNIILEEALIYPNAMTHLAC
jgi:hypothetical protein